MQCECGKISTILVENEDGTVTPKCESCYLDPKYEDLEDLKKCTHPVKYKKIICGACDKQLLEDTSQPSDPADGEKPCKCERLPIRLACNQCGGLVPVKTCR